MGLHIRHVTSPVTNLALIWLKPPNFSLFKNSDTNLSWLESARLSAFDLLELQLVLPLDVGLFQSSTSTILRRRPQQVHSFDVDSFQLWPSINFDIAFTQSCLHFDIGHTYPRRQSPSTSTSTEPFFPTSILSRPRGPTRSTNFDLVLGSNLTISGLRPTLS